MNTPLSDEEIVRGVLESLESRSIGQSPRFWIVVEHFMGERRRKGSKFTINDFRKELEKMSWLCLEVIKAIDGDSVHYKGVGRVQNQASVSGWNDGGFWPQSTP